MFRCAFLSVIFFAEFIRAADNKGGMPQLNPESFVSQIFWLTFLFFILFLLIHYFFLPKVIQIRKERQDTIDNYLNDAKRINDSINSIINEMKNDFDNAKNKQASELNKTLEENKIKLNKKISEINEDFENKKVQLDIDINKNRDSITSDLPSICVKLSDILYERVMKVKKQGNIEEFKRIIGEK